VAAGQRGRDYRSDGGSIEGSQRTDGGESLSRRACAEAVVPRLLEGRHKVARLYSVRQSVGGQVQAGAGRSEAGGRVCRRVGRADGLRGDGVAAGVRWCGGQWAVTERW
jgi:hypothetical protein